MGGPLHTCGGPPFYPSGTNGLFPRKRAYSREEAARCGPL